MLLILLFFSFDLIYAGDTGVIFREYSYNTGRWGETDPGATHPMQKEWSRRVPKILESVDLENAVKAELCVEYWGGHIGTGEQKFKVNGSDWIYIPQPKNTPNNPSCYYRTLLGNPAVDVPLKHLKNGSNEFVFTCGPQIKYNFNFGFYWIYAFTLRIYYDESVPHPTGEIVFPYPGAIIGDSPVIAAAAESADDSIRQVDFIGYYEDYDWEGNGEFKDWHYQYQKGKIKRHLGTAKSAPYAVTWDNTWVPDQESPMKIRARITDNKGITYLTPPVDNISLMRPDRSVKMYTSPDVPEVFGAYRAQKNECTIPVQDAVYNLQAARLALSTWSGEELSEIGLNDKKIAENAGYIINYSHDLIPVPADIIRRGANTFYAFSFSDYHKAEINWPGPALLINFKSVNDKTKELTAKTMLNALNHSYWQVRAYAAENLGKMKISSAINILIARLKDESWQVRAAAAKALGQIGDEAAINPLLEVLRAEEPYSRPIWRVRRNAAEALAKMRGPEAQALLEKAVNDEDKLIRGYVEYALEKIKKPD